MNTVTEPFVDLRLAALQPLDELGRLAPGHQLQPLVVVQLVLYVLHRELRRAPGLAHAVPGYAAVRAQGIGASELVDVAGLQLLAVLEPPQERRGGADHFALEGHEALFRQDGL